MARFARRVLVLSFPRSSVTAINLRLSGEFGSMITAK